MTRAEEVILADLCEQMHDLLEDPDRILFSDIRELMRETLRASKALISDKQLMIARNITHEPEDF